MDQSDWSSTNRMYKMKSKSLFSAFVFVIILGVGLVAAYAAQDTVGSTFFAVSGFVVALVISSAIKIANPWDKAVVANEKIMNRYASTCFPHSNISTIVTDTVYFIDPNYE